MQGLKEEQERRTYSQADLAKFPTRKKLGKCIKKYFKIGSGKVTLQHWAYSGEKY